MQKTKLGISVALLGAALYFLGLFSGYLATILVAGYVLLCESDEWLKKSAVKAVAVLVLFSLASAVIGLIPNVISFVDSVFSVFGRDFHIYFVTNIINVITTALNIIEKLLLLILGFFAFKKETVKLPIIDDFIDKQFSNTEA